MVTSHGGSESLTAAATTIVLFVCASVRMTVKSGSLHIKRKSLLTFPQSRPSDWHRGGMSRCIKAEPHCTGDTSHIQQCRFMNGAPKTQETRHKPYSRLSGGNRRRQVQICSAKTSRRGGDGLKSFSAGCVLCELLVLSSD